MVRSVAYRRRLLHHLPGPRVMRIPSLRSAGCALSPSLALAAWLLGACTAPPLDIPLEEALACEQAPQGLPAELARALATIRPANVYHETLDTIYRINPDMLADVTRLAFLTAYRLAETPSIEVTASAAGATKEKEP
ncbi:MAG: hypothetical protein AB1486_31165 [Planctomycetota bacterium]